MFFSPHQFAKHLYEAHRKRLKQYGSLRKGGCKLHVCVRAIHQDERRFQRIIQRLATEEKLVQMARLNDIIRRFVNSIGLYISPKTDPTSIPLFNEELSISSFLYKHRLTDLALQEEHALRMNAYDKTPYVFRFQVEIAQPDHDDDDHVWIPSEILITRWERSSNTWSYGLANLSLEETTKKYPYHHYYNQNNPNERRDDEKEREYRFRFGFLELLKQIHNAHHERDLAPPASGAVLKKSHPAHYYAHIAEEVLSDRQFVMSHMILLGVDIKHSLHRTVNPLMEANDLAQSIRRWYHHYFRPQYIPEDWVTPQCFPKNNLQGATSRFSSRQRVLPMDHFLEWMTWLHVSQQQNLRIRPRSPDDLQRLMHFALCSEASPSFIALDRSKYMRQRTFERFLAFAKVLGYKEWPNVLYIDPDPSKGSSGVKYCYQQDSKKQPTKMDSKSIKQLFDQMSMPPPTSSLLHLSESVNPHMKRVRLNNNKMY